MNWSGIEARATDPADPERRDARVSTMRHSFGQDGEIALIADAAARITYCSGAAAVLFVRSPEALVGCGLDELIPSLPVSTMTPGYNVAYARMQSAGRGWQRHSVLTADGRRLDVELMLDAASIRGRFMIAVTLRPAYGELQGHA